MSALMSVLYHIGIMQLLIKGVAWVMVRVMGTSGAESLLQQLIYLQGKQRHPLVVKPYLGNMTRSELMALMGGMATVAGGVLAAYVGMGIDAGSSSRCIRYVSSRCLGLCKVTCSRN